MKNCTDCKYAEWNKTKTGRLHPSGKGECTFEYKVPQLPASMHWLLREPAPFGGLISRKHHLYLSNDCVYYTERDRK